MDNLKEFKALIERYESITLEEIKKAVNRYNNNELLVSDYASIIGQNIAECITGFGSFNCTLCIPIGSECKVCVWDKTGYSCISGLNNDSYVKIEIASTPLSLLKAFKERAKYMRSILKD